MSRESILHDAESKDVDDAIWQRTYAKAEAFMDYVKEDGNTTGVWLDSFTAKIATDMLLQRMGTKKIQGLLNDDMLFFQRMVECMVDHGCDEVKN
jgi:hypothetical protein